MDLALAEINFDFSQGLQIVLPLTHLQNGLFTKHSALLVCQIEAASSWLNTPRVDLTLKFLLEVYPPDHLVTLIWTASLPEYTIHSKALALKNLVSEYGEAKFFSACMSANEMIPQSPVSKNSRVDLRPLTDASCQETGTWPSARGRHSDQNKQISLSMSAA